MYCTGGIRCERATALLNQMVAASGSGTTEEKEKDKNSSIDNKPKEDPSSVITCKPKGVFELRGGIERYVKTFPKGGFWKGKNYLFDRRMEQIPAERKMTDVEDEIDANCCVCLQKWSVYRGQYNCSSNLCGVPVIVCSRCVPQADTNPKSLQCDLCRDNYRGPQARPNLAEIKRKAEARTMMSSTSDANKKQKLDNTDLKEGDYYPDRLFISRLPLTATVTKLQQALLPPEVPLTHAQRQAFRVHWLTDPTTNAFYGSCIVQMPNARVVTNTVSKAKSHADKTTRHGIRVDKKRIKVAYVRKLKEEENRKSKSKQCNAPQASAELLEGLFSLPNFTNAEYPPLQ